jgi:tetratricopeptide (TPR) repeat protein
LQERARILTDEHKNMGLFTVEVWSWDDIWHQLYQRRELFRKIADSYWPRLSPPGAESHVSRLPVTNSTLLGRESELARLEIAWERQANHLQIIAPGGTGKTALITTWYKRHVGEVPIVGWSFYRQGATENSPVSSDEFLQAAVDRLELQPKTMTAESKVAALVHHLRQHRSLLILDGLEPLQNHANGEFYDYPLKYLLRELAAQNAGLVLCTTRVRLSDIPDDERALSIDLDNLSAVDGSRYLRETFGVHGNDEDIATACKSYGYHALALTLLGTYLRRRGGDISNRFEIDELPAPDTKSGHHARRLVQTYANLFAGTPEGATLRGLGFFDRPVARNALKLVLPDQRLDDDALATLAEARLILNTEHWEPIDCHPLVREHFGSLTKANEPDGFRLGHSRLYDHYCGGPEDPLPQSLTEMAPLFRAVRHGCLAGRFDDALFGTYEARIQHGEGKYYLLKTLGAFGANQSLMTNFFKTRWSITADGLSREGRSQALGIVSFGLRALGQLRAALEPMALGAQSRVDQEHWKSAAVTHNNLVELRLSLGDVGEAIRAGVAAVDYARVFGDAFQWITNLSILAMSLFAAGEFKEASRRFQDAERLQVESNPSRPLLHGLPGYRYCDFLLSQGDIAAVRRRTAIALPWALEQGELLPIGLHYMLAGTVNDSDDIAANQALDSAVASLRKYADITYLPLALLARGTDADLTEVRDLAMRANMQLHLADYNLAAARREQDNRKARKHLEDAARIITETGYHRRDVEVSLLSKQLWGQA